MTVSEKTVPALSDDTVNVVFSTDRKYLANTVVSIKSLITCASKGRKYHVLLMHDGISEEKLGLVSSLADGFNNITISFFDGRVFTGDSEFYLGERKEFSAPTFFRLFIPWALKDRDKAVYLDGDVILKKDIAELFDTDLAGKPLGAVIDIGALEACLKKCSSVRKERTIKLQMKDPENYINSGILLMNLAAFRREFSKERMLKIALEYTWRLHDQDILNFLFSDRIKLLDLKWNYVSNREFWSRLPKKYLVKVEESSKDPYIIHFTSWSKPWRLPKIEHAKDFWTCAQATPFYDELIKQMCDAPVPANAILDVTAECFLKGQIGMRYIIKYFKNWMLYKLGFGVKE